MISNNPNIDKPVIMILWSYKMTSRFRIQLTEIFFTSIIRRSHCDTVLRKQDNGMLSTAVAILTQACHYITVLIKQFPFLDSICNCCTDMTTLYEIRRLRSLHAGSVVVLSCAVKQCHLFGFSMQWCTSMELVPYTPKAICSSYGVMVMIYGITQCHFFNSGYEIQTVETQNGSCFLKENKMLKVDHVIGRLNTCTISKEAKGK